MIFDYVLVLISVLLMIASLVLLFATVIPKQYKELRMPFKELKGIRRSIFYAQLFYLVLVIFLVSLAIPYLLNPVKVRITAFLYSYFVVGFLVFLNSIMWYFIYNVEAKRPLYLTKKPKKNKI